MASMRDIKRRKSSVQSTQQITKAMKLVSTVKLQRARGNAERSQGYYECMYKTVQSILARTGNIDHKYLQSGNSPKKAVIAITSNRGLAGGYNSNIIKLVTQHEEWKKEDVVIYAIGSKGRDAFYKSGYEVQEDLSAIAEEPVFAEAIALTDRLLKAFEKEEIGEIYLAYTVFKNTVSHVPTLLQLLPVSRQEAEAVGENDNVLMNFESDEENVLDVLISKYITSVIYGGMLEAITSENGARMQAMDNATNNAEEMISDLTLKYNRARQSSITQELTEIIAGAEAIS